MIWSKKQFLLFCILHTCLCAYSQEIAKPQSLQSVLSTLETRFNITFTYSDVTISGVQLVPPATHLTVAETLEYLHRETGLDFHQLNERFIAIGKPASATIDICGILVDRETGDRIDGAVIRLNDRYVISDASGEFHLSDVPENANLIIQSLGFRRASVPAEIFQVSPCQPLQLIPQTTTLQELIVTDYLTEGITKATDGSFRISPKQLGILPGLIEPDVLQTIQALPGIQSADETISNINIRGGTNDQNLVLWDGIKMYQTGHFFGLISAFNPYLTQNISLIKNGTSSSLGDGVSGTINMESIDTVAKRFSGGMGVNMIHGDFFLRIPVTNNLSIQVSSRRSISDIIQTPTYDQYFDRTFRDTDVSGNVLSDGDTVTTSKKNFNFYDVNFKVLYDVTKRDKLRLNFLRISNDITYQENLRGDNRAESRTSNLSQASTGLGLSYSHLWGDRLRSVLEGYLSGYQLDGTNFDILNDQRLRQENKVLDIGGKLGILYRISNRLDLFTGYQFYEVGVTNSDDINNPPFSRLIKRVLQTHVFFAEGNLMSRSNATNLRTGVRINYLSKFDKILFEPRMAFSHRFGEALALELSGEIKSQTTSQVIDLPNDFLGVEKRKWILSDNGGIPIITSRQLSAGFTFNYNGMLISLEGYLKEVKNITTSGQGFQNQFQFVRSSGNYSVEGIDFMINQKVNNLRMWFSYSLAHNTYQFNELIPPSFPNNLDIRHSISLAGSYSTSGFQISAGLRWHSGRPYTEPIPANPVESGTILYQAPNNVRLNDYLRIDLSARYNFRLSPSVKAQAGASIWNLANRTNLISQYYMINDSGELQPLERRALGLTPNLMFRIEF